MGGPNLGYADADPYFRILGRTQNRRKKLDSQTFQSELCSPAARPVFRYPEQNQHSDFHVAATTNFPVMLSHSQEGHTCRATSSSLLSNSFSRIFHLHFSWYFSHSRAARRISFWSGALQLWAPKHQGPVFSARLVIWIQRWVHLKLSVGERRPMQRGTQRAAARDGAHLAWWLPLRDHQFSCRVGARHLNHLFFLLILRGYPRELRG